VAHQPERLGVQAGTTVTMDVTERATLALQVAVAGTPPQAESLHVTVDGTEVDATVLPTPAAGRQHVVQVPPGRLEVRYEVSCPPTVVGHQRVSLTERVEATRPSRYCPSDRVLGLAAAEFGGRADDAETMHAICEYVAGHTAYVSGSSTVTTDAVETLLSGQGVCRDYAHTVAMLGRAAGIPTRIASVYAPGLSPMDMHAVVEAAVDGVWRVFDATRLAPRQSLVRIGTGRDAADIAFLSVLDGRADLVALEVRAVYDGDLPRDDHRELISLPPA
jgi:transglutaminase-like putative cysteine protease